jgi:uncharacterized protein YbbC (DUF1343 family)
VLLICSGEILKEIDNKIYFIYGETFILILKSIKGYLVDKFKFTFDKSEDLQQKRISFTRKKAKWRKMKLKSNTVSGN